MFVDALEWREILVTLTGFACETISGRVLVATSVPAGSAPSGFAERVDFVSDGDAAALAQRLGARGRSFDLARIPLDYDLFGGAAALDRAMSASLFGDVGTAPLLASRPDPRRVSPVAALARLEGPVAGGPVVLTPETALAPLRAVQSAVRRVEWWDRSFEPSWMPLLEEVWRLGVRQSVRLRPELASGGALAEFKRLGVRRIVFECAAKDVAPEAEAAERCHAAGLEAGVLLVIGIPGETAAVCAARCEKLRRAGIDRVRVVPFEPTGGTEAWELAWRKAGGRRRTTAGTASSTSRSSSPRAPSTRACSRRR